MPTPERAPVTREHRDVVSRTIESVLAACGTSHGQREKRQGWVEPGEATGAFSAAWGIWAQAIADAEARGASRVISAKVDAYTEPLPGLGSLLRRAEEALSRSHVERNNGFPELLADIRAALGSR